MAFLEQQLDARITRDTTFTESVPGRSLIRLPNGRLSQNFVSALPILRCELAHGIRTAANYQTVLDAWMVVNFTPYDGLRVKNWRDYTATQSNSKLTLVSGSNYQLQRRHVFGGVEMLRNIIKPVNNGALTVFRTRAGTVTTASATVDYATGIAAITGHVAGDTYTWLGEFDFPMTFSENEWSAALEVSVHNLHVVSGSITLEEVRP
ncbi:DUF2460 domain-containing protein [Methylibium sp.]|uniref:DUF2460 domain-containing protein n=1 Tax=Methylibium sp. TaxID=2067992 RepID=UPI0017D56E98|nr:DUF2460 domain-containing protein [Methylibium sp.]MBA3588306.1 DUF2460 domain-containing protein [Methylibium sp.]